MRFFNLIYVPIFIYIIISCGKDTRGEINTKTLPIIELEHQLTITDSDDLVLLQITDVKSDSKGRIYLNDQRALRIHVYERNGTYLRSIGQEGSGPGEFQSLLNILIDHCDRLVTIDINLARNTIFIEKNGRWTVDQIFSIEGSSFYAIESIAPNGEVILNKTLIRMPEPSEYWQEHELALGHLTSRLIQDNIYQFRGMGFLLNDDGFNIVKPYGRTTISYAGTVGKFFIVWNDKFDLAIFDSSMNHIDSLSVPIPNQLVTNEEKDELLNIMGDRFRSLGRRYLQDTKPVIKNMFVDKDENFWLQTYDSPEYLILNRKGLPIGSFNLNHDMQLAHVDENSIYAIQSDDEGYKVQVYGYKF